MASPQARSQDRLGLAEQYVLVSLAPAVREVQRYPSLFPKRRYVPECTAGDLAYDFSLESAVLEEAQHLAEQKLADTEESDRVRLAAERETAKEKTASQSSRSGSPNGDGAVMVGSGVPDKGTGEGDARSSSPRAAGGTTSVHHTDDGDGDQPTAHAAASSPQKHDGEEGAAATEAKHDRETGYLGESAHPAPWFVKANNTHEGVSNDMSDLIDKLLLSNPAHHYRTAPSSDGHSAAPPPNQHPGTSLPTSGSGFDLLFPDLPAGSPHHYQASTASSLIRNPSTISLSEFDTLHHNSTPFDSATLHTLNDREELRRLLAPPPPAANVDGEHPAAPMPRADSDSDSRSDGDNSEGDDGGGLLIKADRGPPPTHHGSTLSDPRQPAASSERTFVRKITLIDTNGDGARDSLAVDADGDGRVDRVYLTRPAVLLDNTDGRGAEGLAFDGNGDGQFDRVVPLTSTAAHARGRDSRGAEAFDGTGDGQTNAIPFDANGDGRIDTVSMMRPAFQVDASGDGAANSVAYDRSGDGRLDTVVPLSNGPYGRHTGWVSEPVVVNTVHHDDHPRASEPRAAYVDDSLEASLADWLNSTPAEQTPHQKLANSENEPVAVPSSSASSNRSAAPASTPTLTSLYPTLDAGPPESGSGGRVNPSSPSVERGNSGDGGGGGGEDGVADTDGAGSQFVQMGFPPTVVKYALQKLPEGNDDDILTFLLPVADLHEAGHSMDRLLCVNFTPESDYDTTKATLDKVAQLEAMGFPTKSAVDALGEAKGNLEMAAAVLIS